MLSIIPLAISAGSTIEYTAYILLNYQKTACVMISVTIAFLIGFGYFWDTPQQLCSMAHKHNVNIFQNTYKKLNCFKQFIEIIQIGSRKIIEILSHAIRIRGHYSRSI